MSIDTSPLMLAQLREWLQKHAVPRETSLALLDALEEAQAALGGLVTRLDEIHADPAYKSVWTVHQLHVGPYSGPTYVEALKAARDALDDGKAAP